MKKNILTKIFIAVFVLISLVPSLGMIVAKSDTTSENRRLAEFPSVMTEDNEFNEKFFTQLGDYFNDHFAFRSYIISIDSYIQSKLFGVSNVDTVIVGTDGWLYYMDTLNNYKGQNLMSERALNNVVHNIELMKEHVEKSGAEFLITIAPNKNTLYPDNMPYYLRSKVSEERDANKISLMLTQKGINYADLFELFSTQDEVLYFKRDSHWNTKGAHLVYNEIMKHLNIDFDDYSELPLKTDGSFIGDLQKMVYPLSKKSEPDDYYNYEKTYTVVTPDASPEAALIVTENEKKTSSLLMYRDSFGNSLYPIFANAFGKCAFSKATPYNLQLNMLTYKPEVVVVEKVERNLYDFAEYPPVFSSPLRPRPLKVTENLAEVELKAEVCQTNTNLVEITGEIPDSVMKNDSVVYVNVKSGIRQNFYEAFSFSVNDNDNCFKLILDKNKLVNADEIEIYLSSADNCEKISTEKFDVTKIQEVNL